MARAASSGARHNRQPWSWVDSPKLQQQVVEPADRNDADVSVMAPCLADPLPREDHANAFHEVRLCFRPGPPKPDMCSGADAESGLRS